MVLFLAACGSQATTFDPVPGPAGKECEPLYEDSQAARDLLLLLRDEVEACTEPCPTLEEALHLALVQYVHAFDDWWACADGPW